MSVTLERTQLDTSHRPTEEIACSRCPHALWFQTRRTLKCYCRQMCLIVWESHSLPNGDILNCDGLRAMGEALETPPQAMSTSRAPIKKPKEKRRQTVIPASE